MLRVLTWNLFHGRSVPPAGRDLAGCFTAMIASWKWDIALLQEVPPWWTTILADATAAQARLALTSRNGLLPLRRVLARRAPDLMRSNGGGANLVLVRPPDAIAAHRAVRLRLLPERRVAQLLMLRSGLALANLHATTRRPLAREETNRLFELLTGLAPTGPAILAGDLNLRDPLAPDGSHFAHLAARDVDHVFARDLTSVSPPELLDRRVTLPTVPDRTEALLSDHPPLRVSLQPTGGTTTPYLQRTGGTTTPYQ